MAERDNTLDAVRTARLVFDAELAAAQLAPDALIGHSAIAAMDGGGFSAAHRRFGDGVARKLGRLDPERASSEALMAVRRSVLGERASAPARFLVRVDEYPHAFAWDEPERCGTSAYQRFHEIMYEAGVPYLIAVPPRVSRSPLDPGRREWRPLDDGEVAMLGRLHEAGVTLALHGRDHRTRFRSPRRRSELGGLDGNATATLLDSALAELAAYCGLRPQVFVPPFNRFDRVQWPVLADRFDVVGGGPESIMRFGFQRTPQWRGEAVFLPAYWPLYGRAGDVLPAVRRAVEQRRGLWLPIVLHWQWEADRGWRELETLVKLLAPHAVPWTEFLAAVARSR